MSEACVRINFDSELPLVKDVVGRILDYLKSRLPYINEDDLFDFRLLYQELLVNAVTHGNGEDPSKKVELTIMVEPGSVVTIIRDEGKGFDHNRELRRQAPSTGEHGRGLTLIRALSDYLCFNPEGNMVVVGKKLCLIEENPAYTMEMVSYA